METHDEPDERALCPDGACTGVLRDDGRCGTCGRLGEGAPPAPPAAAETFREALLEHAPEALVEALAAAEPALDVDDRVPCDDGMCTGVVGPDGRCGTCGRATTA